MPDPAFRDLMIAGVGRVKQAVQAQTPYSAGSINGWIDSLAGTPQPADYFMHPAAFPLMLLPYWIERQLVGKHDSAFQTDLIASNAAMYYYIRLVDNVMDGHATVEQKLLPAAGYFVNLFQSYYRSYFDHQHPFWAFFSATWSEFCDVTVYDGQLSNMDEATFLAIIGRKVCAAKLAVGAVCFRSEHPEVLPQWSAWIDLFGRWHLFQEDLFDWNQDLSLGAVTYILCEANRRKASDELVVTWIAREGLEWALNQLGGWMRELRRADFLPTEVYEYLDQREQALITQQAKIRAGLDFLQRLSESVPHHE